MAADIAALIQALQGGNATAVNNAVTALGTDVHNNAGGATDLANSLAHGGGTADAPAAPHQHFEHMWS